MMEDWGLDISAGELNRILVEDKEEDHTEKQEILEVGLSRSHDLEGFLNLRDD